MIRFVSFADARFADAIVGPRAAPRSVLDHRHRRAPVRPRVGASACRARARSTRRDARKTEKPKNRKTEKPKNRNRNRKRTSTATISRASEVRQNPTYCFPTRHKNRSVGHPCASPGVVARRRKPTRARCRATRKKRRRRRWNTARRRVDDDARERSTRARKRENRARGRTTGAGRGRARDRGRGGRRATTEGEGRDGRGRPDDDDDANDGIAMMGTDGARRANRAGFGAGADGERGGRGGAFEGDARARGGEGDEITARSMRLTTMRARWWMFGFTVEDDAV